MNKSILNIEIQEFINSNLNSEITKLVLKGSPFPHVSIQELTEQIESKNKCKNKLPTWFNTPNIYYPNKLNIEQTSSEITAQYKSQLVSGKSLLDLTGGFGIDCYYFSKRIESVTHCEWNQELSTIVQHNCKQLQTHINTQATNGLEFLSDHDDYFDWIYVDPSRRHDSKGKVFFLRDCEPNLPEHLGLIFKHTKRVLIKTSPLLDIKAGLDELESVKEIHCVAINNEMKELLWLLEKEYSGTVAIKTINLSERNHHQVFDFHFNEIEHTAPKIGNPKTYLYEPNAAILKSGAFNLVSNKIDVEKLQLNSHLYTSNKLLKNFPGRIFKIEKTLPYSKSNLKELHLTKANITTRNFPETVDFIRKKYNIKDGGETYLFFTTIENGTKIVLVCNKTVND